MLVVTLSPRFLTWRGRGEGRKYLDLHRGSKPVPKKIRNCHRSGGGGGGRMNKARGDTNHNAGLPRNIKRVENQDHWTHFFLIFP